MRLLYAFLAAGAFLASARATAVDFADPDWKWRLSGEGVPAVSFRGLDADADGVLSRAEVRRNALLMANFALADADGDGRLSPLEFNRAALELSAAEPSPVPGTSP